MQHNTEIYGYYYGERSVKKYHTIILDLIQKRKLEESCNIIISSLCIGPKYKIIINLFDQNKTNKKDSIIYDKHSESKIRDIINKTPFLFDKLSVVDYIRHKNGDQPKRTHIFVTFPVNSETFLKNDISIVNSSPISIFLYLQSTMNIDEQRVDAFFEDKKINPKWSKDKDIFKANHFERSSVFLDTSFFSLEKLLKNNLTVLPLKDIFLRELSSSITKRNAEKKKIMTSNLLMIQIDNVWKKIIHSIIDQTNINQIGKLEYSSLYKLNMIKIYQEGLYTILEKIINEFSFSKEAYSQHAFNSKDKIKDTLEDDALIRLLVFSFAISLDKGSLITDSTHTFFGKHFQEFFVYSTLINFAKLINSKVSPQGNNDKESSKKEYIFPKIFKLPFESTNTYTIQKRQRIHHFHPHTFDLIDSFYSYLSIYFTIFNIDNSYDNLKDLFYLRFASL